MVKNTNRHLLIHICRAGKLSFALLLKTYSTHLIVATTPPFQTETCGFYNLVCGQPHAVVVTLYSPRTGPSK